jgi:hypothetical protein
MVRLWRGETRGGRVVLGALAAAACLLGAARRPAGASGELPPVRPESRLEASDLRLGAHHTRHAEVLGRRSDAAGRAVLAGVDTVQKSAPDGGGYFIGHTLRPPESPIGYELRLFGHPLLTPPRTTSYCSGATYAALVEALNILCPDGAPRLSPERLEALRMQEPDGSMRGDYVKIWGSWNSQWGQELVLARRTGMGRGVPAADALPGDFVNIAWKRGKGHAGVFLGWADREGRRSLLIWSSQKMTHGLGDRLVPLAQVREARFVRLTDPEKVFAFDVKW